MVMGPGSVNLRRRPVFARANVASAACTARVRRMGPTTVGTSAR